MFFVDSITEFCSKNVSKIKNCFFRYIAAILQGHVVPAIPYISDAATYSPESCVFGQFINIGCVLCKLFFYNVTLQYNA